MSSSIQLRNKFYIFFKNRILELLCNPLNRQSQANDSTTTSIEKKKKKKLGWQQREMNRAVLAFASLTDK
jgi:hypothetical protein